MAAGGLLADRDLSSLTLEREPLVVVHGQDRHEVHAFLQEQHPSADGVVQSFFDFTCVAALDPLHLGNLEEGHKLFCFFWAEIVSVNVELLRVVAAQCSSFLEHCVLSPSSSVSP